MNEILKQFDNFYWKYNEGLQIFTSGINPVTQNLKLNGFRTIFQQILNQLSLRNRSNSDVLILKLLEHDEELLNNLDLVYDILNLQRKGGGNNKEKNLGMSLNNKELTPKMQNKLIKRIMISILKGFLESKVIEDFDGSRHKKKLSLDKMCPPLIIFLDDMQDFDSISWSVCKSALKNVPRIFIIGLVRNEYVELPPIFSKKNRYSLSEDRLRLNQIEESLNNIEDLDNLEKFQIGNLNRKDLEIFINTFFKINKIEIEKSNILKKNFCGYQFFYFKLGGHPCVTKYYIEGLIQQDFAEIIDNVLLLKENFLKSIEIDEFLGIYPPLDRIKVIRI